MGLDGEAAGFGPEREATREEQAVVIADHFDTGAELGPGVVGAAGLAALCLEVSHGIGAIRELEHEVSGAGHVAAQAVGHHLSADHLHLIPERVGKERVDPGGVVGWVGWMEIRRRRVPALVGHGFQRLMNGVAARFPDVTAGHDRLHLGGGLGDRRDQGGDGSREDVAIGQAIDVRLVAGEGEGVEPGGCSWNQGHSGLSR